MTGPSFTTALTTLGLDNHQAAAWLGVSVRAVQRYRVTGAPKMAERLINLTIAAKPVLDIFPLSLDHMDALEFALDWRE